MADRSTKELGMLKKAATEFARNQLISDRQEHDAYPFGPYFDTVLQKAYDVDFFHTLLPENADGMNQGMQGLCAILDPICQADSSLGGILFTNAFGQQILLCADEAEAMTSIASSGSGVSDFLIAFPVFNNPMDIEPMVEAAESEGGYVLNGAVEYLVLGGIAKNAVVPATIPGRKGYSFFLVQMAEAGITKSDPVVSLGFHACPAIDVMFNGVKGKLIGAEGKGDTYFTGASNIMSAAAAAISLGLMKGSYKEAYAFSRKREQGGREIYNWSEIKMILANMAVKLKMAEMAVSQAGYAVDNALDGWQKCSQAAAIYVSEMACDVTTDGIQVLGGVGYMDDYGQAKRYRDAKQAQSLLGLAPMKKIRYLEN